MQTPNGSPEERTSPLRSAWRHFWYGDGGVAWVRSAIIAVVLTLLIRWPLIEPYSIPSGSMEPTLQGDPRFLRGDRVFVNKWIYGVRVPFKNQRLWRGTDPERWDLVVFRAVEDDPRHKILVKRVVGLPGERIQIARGRVYVDGVPLEIPPEIGAFQYTSSGQYGVSPQDEFSVVPPDHYLLLGDNSAHSRDGRMFGWVPNSHLIGRVACVWWPVGHVSDFTGFTTSWWWRGSWFLLCVFLVWRLVIGRSWRTQGAELGPAFDPSAHLYINRLAYGLPLPMSRVRLTSGRPPKRGEIVSYYARVNGHTVVLAGRVAGMPGEDVALANGALSINGETVACVDPNEAPSGAPRQLTVANGHYFVVTDDTESLPDSRMLGTIPERNLIGPATAVWWPPSKWMRL